ncbi:hypothetical protein [Streptomyces sp. NPDC095613]|uniref:hypothetical protein n=1 Tax=Streptomyces sp. NPDC095613 TaxID=3155540 RepID=UPI00331D8460
MSQVERAERRLHDRRPGERVLYAVLAFRVGGVRTTMIGGAAGIAGAAGAAAAAAVTRGAGAGTPARGLKLPGRCFVVLTDERLLFYSIGGVFVGTPKTVLYEFDIARVTSVEEPESQHGIAQALRAGIGFDDGSVIRFEFPRLAVPDGRNLVNRLRLVLAERSTGESTGEPTTG